MPKEFSLISLTHCDVNEKILFKASSGTYTRDFALHCHLGHQDFFSHTSQNAIYNLHRGIGNRIGQMLQTNSDGSLFVVESKIPKYDVPITIEPIMTPTTSSSTQTDPVPKESIEKQKGNEQEEPIQVEMKETPKAKEKEDKAEKQSAWRWAPGPSGRLCWEEYEPEVPNADNLSSREAGINPGTSTASSKTKTRKSLLQISNKRHSSSSSSSSRQPAIEIPSEYATSSSEIEFTDSGSDSETTTVPRLDHFDPVSTDQQMVRDEIKFAMHDLLKCLAEHVEGIS